jgi:hypothetical protein
MIITSNMEFHMHIALRMCAGCSTPSSAYVVDLLKKDRIGEISGSQGGEF